MYRFKNQFDIRQLIIVLIVCGLFLAEYTSAATIDGVRLWRAPDNTRIVFDLTGPVEHKLFTLENPSRLVIDIANTRNSESFSEVDLTSTPIKRIRSAVQDQRNLRVVFDLQAAVKPRSFVLKKHADKPDRLVIDLYDDIAVIEKTLEQITEKTTAPARRDILIVVDAGHGGEDPGAIGPRRIREKDVVLDIAKQLAERINNTQGYKAKLTRTNDYYVPLRKRRDFARQHRADLFVSIHADAYKTAEARGASVFALSRRGATSETARFLAQKENDADLIGGVGDVSLDDKDELLKGVLVDLSMNATLGSSLDAGQHILQKMGGIAHLHKRSVEQAGFLVLKSPDVPSILVETGFISNPKEAKKLATKSYRKEMAESIFSGIRHYFEKSPPAGTYIAWMQDGGASLVAANTTATYKVARGDTLSGIADRFNLSIAELKALNQLSSSVIRVGQTLTVRKPVSVAVNPIVHQVSHGETLSGIALRYSSSVTAILKENNMNGTSIRIGQKLLIPSVVDG